MFNNPFNNRMNNYFLDIKKLYLFYFTIVNKLLLLESHYLIYWNLYQVLYLIRTMKQNSLFVFCVGTFSKICNKIVFRSIAPSQKKSRNINIIILGKLFKHTQRPPLISLIHTKLLGKLLMFTAWVVTSGSVKLKQKEMTWKYWEKSQQSKFSNLT